MLPRPEKKALQAVDIIMFFRLKVAEVHGNRISPPYNKINYLDTPSVLSRSSFTTLRSINSLRLLICISPYRFTLSSR